MANPAPDVGDVNISWWDHPFIPGRRLLKINRADPTCWITDNLLAELTFEAGRRAEAGHDQEDPTDGLSYDPVTKMLTIRGRSLDEKDQLTITYEVTDTFSTLRESWMGRIQLTTRVPLDPDAPVDGAPE